jgi:hypothetical protein
MCYVSYQIDCYLAAQDRMTAREEWLGMKGEDDSYGRYQFDAAEQLDGTLSAADNAVLEDLGMDGWDLLSNVGKEAIKDRAMDLAIEDGFSRYEE